MTTFNHVTDISQRDIVSTLEDNIKDFIDWGLLNIGAFVNVNIPVSSGNIGLHSLKPVSGDPSVVFPRSWESGKQSWIYETEVSYKNTSPIGLSGVYLNGTFLPAPTGSGSYGYHVDYVKGRINFTNNVSANSSVQLSYSFRLVHTYKASDNLIWKDIVDNNYNLPAVSNSGTYSANAIQLPAVVVQLAPRSVLIPYELGTTSNILQQDVLIHILTDNAVQRNNLIDILLKQKDKTLNLYDVNKAIKNNRQSLNYRGEVNSNRFNYDQISTNPEYITHRCYIVNAVLSEIQSITTSLHHGVIRWSAQIFP